MWKGGVIRHECSRSDLNPTNYDIYHEFLTESPTLAEKWQDWSLFSHTFPPASLSYPLPSGDTLTFNPYLVEVVNNTFEMNLRGSHSSVIYFDHTPLFSLSDNRFYYNGDILIAGLAASLD